MYAYLDHVDILVSSPYKPLPITHQYSPRHSDTLMLNLNVHVIV